MKTSNSSNYREVYNANDQMHAQLASTLLADAGIECMIEHETLNQVWGGVMGPSNGVSIVVREDDYEEARRILIEGELIPADDLADHETTNGSTQAEGKEGARANFQRMSLKKQLLYVVLIIVVLLALLSIYNLLLN